ncbi:hypothetical protein CR513_56925, partial [Mucuna pruriens]
MPQENDVVERKNKSFQEIARTILNDFNSHAEAINTTYYLQNKIYIKPILKKTPYELWKDLQKPSKESGLDNDSKKDKVETSSRS